MAGSINMKGVGGLGFWKVTQISDRDIHKGSPQEEVIF